MLFDFWATNKEYFARCLNLFNVFYVVTGKLAYSFRGQGTLEIELTCPVTPYQIVLGRMLVIFGYNTIVGLTGSAVLVGSNSGLIFSALIMDWLAPMLLWGAMLFYRFNLFGFAYGQWVKSLLTPEVMTLSGLGPGGILFVPLYLE